MKMIPIIQKTSFNLYIPCYARTRDPFVAVNKHYINPPFYPVLCTRERKKYMRRDKKEGLCSAYLLSQKGPWTCEQVSKWNKSLSFGGLSLKSLNFVKKYFVI